MDWFTAKDEKVEGPMASEQLGSRIASGELSKDSLVWREGFEDWSMVRDQPELAVFTRRLPPPLPQKRDDFVTAPVSPSAIVVAEPFDLPPSSPLSTPGSAWSRYFARQIDTTLLGFTVAFSTTIAALYWYPKLYFSLIRMPELFSGLLWFAMAFILNSVIISIFGNSFGKSIFGLEARPFFEKNPNFWWNIKRETRVWLYGCAAGIPFIALFTASINHREVKSGKGAAYDREFAVVSEKPISLFRRGVGMLFAMAIIAGGLGIGAWVKEIDRKATATKSWTNKLTGKTVTLPGGWTVGSMKADDGSELNTFTSQDNVRTVFFGAEDASPFPAISDYTDAMEKVMSDTAIFSGSWTTTVIGTQGVARRDAVTKVDSMAATYVLWKGTGRYWRMVIIDGLAKAGTKLEEAPVIAALVQSVP